MNAYPWSYSKIKAFEQCPFQFLNVTVLRRYAQEETEQMRYGTQFHTAAEEYIRDGTPLPGQFAFAKDLLDKLNSIPGRKICEDRMGVTAALTPCEFDADDVWWRGIGDLIIIDGTRAMVIDYKTGANARYADTGQLELMALGVFARYPEVETVQASLLFVIAKASVKDKYKREDIPKLWQKWLTKHARLEKALETDVWNKHPSGLCRKHCLVEECPHNGRG